jgi:sensor histidine kinase YesM
VMQLRLGDRLRYTLSLTPEAEATQVPPGLLLTLVENAVEHGVMPSLAGAEVTVRAHCDAGQLHLSVHDSGPGLPTDLAEGVGLTNTRARLAQAYGPQARLHLDNAPTGGCIAALHIPLITP